MNFKAKLRKIGNSFGVIIPKNVITNLDIGDEITLNVITEDTPPVCNVGCQKELIIDNNVSGWQWCKKHSTSKFKCGCK